MTVSLEDRMQRVLDRLNVPLRVAYLPGDKSKVHGEIVEDSSIMFIFDKEESEAWATFTHEVLEYRLKAVTYVYRTLINKLIEGFEKVAYEKKEVFLSEVPMIVEIVKRERGEP
jgi:hypothetical protein